VVLRLNSEGGGVMAVHSAAEVLFVISERVFRQESRGVILDEEGYEEPLEKDREIHDSREGFGFPTRCSLYQDGRFG
jgi:hypothetical protein